MKYDDCDHSMGWVIQRLKPLLLLVPLGLSIAAQLPGEASVKPPRRQASVYTNLLGNLEGILKDLERFDTIIAPTGAVELVNTPVRLPAPPAQAIPSKVSEVTVQKRVQLSLAEALSLAVTNDPYLARKVANVDEKQALLRSAWSRFAPTLNLGLSGLGGQSESYEKALVGNATIYSPGSPFLVESGSWRADLLSNFGGLINLTENYVILDYGRAAALGKAKEKLEESKQMYGNQLRELQLDISQTYYAIQLDQQRKRIREAEVFNDQAVRDQAKALFNTGLVPRVDLFRAEAALQQGRFHLAQVEADLLSNQRKLSNQVNVPFDVTLMTVDVVQLQPPWPLDLAQTLTVGFQKNPQLMAIEAARAALLKQADEQAAALLPTLSVFVSAGIGQTSTYDTDRRNTGCCGVAVIPETYSRNYGWSAGLRLNWMLMDGGVSRGQADASLAAARGVAEQQALERNGIRQRLEQAFYHHQASLTQIIAARASVKAAREAFRDMRARYQLGLADYTDVSDTISSLTRAMEDKAVAITMANISYARMLRELLPVPTNPDQPVSLPITLPAAPVSLQ